LLRDFRSLIRLLDRLNEPEGVERFGGAVVVARDRRDPQDAEPLKVLAG